MSEIFTDLDNFDQVLEEIKSCGWDLKNVSVRLQDNKEIVLAAVTNIGWSLQYASKRLQDDEEIVLATVKKKCYAFEFASDRLKSDKAFILKLLMLFKDDAEKLYSIKKYISDELKKELKL